jgi:hypothetical protein
MFVLCEIIWTPPGADDDLGVAAVGEDLLRRQWPNVMPRMNEKTQLNNPHGLTVNQHVWPQASIARFADDAGVVTVVDKIRRLARLVKPDDPIFCANRVWDQRAEAGYMKQIEDAFQRLATDIIDGTVSAIRPEQKATVDAFFSLWKFRAEYKNMAECETVLVGVCGAGLTKDEEERVEKAGALFHRADGAMPGRMLYGMQIQRKIDGYMEDLSSIQWGIIRTLEGHLVVADCPKHTIIPLTPTLCLSSGGQTGHITRENLAEVNRAFREASTEYYFAMDHRLCP